MMKYYMIFILVLLGFTHAYSHDEDFWQKTNFPVDTEIISLDYNYDAVFVGT